MQEDGLSDMKERLKVATLASSCSNKEGQTALNK